MIRWMLSASESDVVVRALKIAAEKYGANAPEIAMLLDHLTDDLTLLAAKDRGLVVV